MKAKLYPYFERILANNWRDDKIEAYQDVFGGLSMTLESIMNYNIGNFTAGKLLSALLVLLICLICTKILCKVFSRLIDRLKFEKSMHCLLYTSRCV